MSGPHFYSTNDNRTQNLAAFFDTIPINIVTVTDKYYYKSPVSPVFHTVATVSIGLKHIYRVRASILQY